MAKKGGIRRTTRLTFDEACDLLESVLGGPARREIVQRALASGGFSESVRSLRGGFRSNAFATRSDRVVLGHLVDDLDRRTRAEGFHVLQAWDFTEHRFTRDSNAVLLLDYFLGSGAETHSAESALAILLDYYVLHVLALLVLRAWDEGQAEATMDRVTSLIEALQGPNGSGLRMVADAETLLLIAVSHYHPEEGAYDNLLERLEALDEAHQLRLAAPGAAIFGSHLRWGFQVLYGRDRARMRKDNASDYPWLQFFLAVLMRRYSRMADAPSPDRARLVGPLLNGLSPDPMAFFADAPSALVSRQTVQAELRVLLEAHADGLLHDFDRLRPSREAYSPLAFHFNFPHNVLVALVAVALHRGTAPNLGFNALLAPAPPGRSIARSPEVLARTLMDYSGSTPERLGAHGAMLIVYDPRTGRHFVDKAIRKIENHRGRPHSTQ